MSLYILVALVAFIIGWLIGVFCNMCSTEARLIQYAADKVPIRVRGYKFILVEVSKQ